MAHDYLSVSDAAARRGVSRNAIYQAVRTGRLPHEVIAGKIVLRERDVDAYTPIPNDARKGLLMGRGPARTVESLPAVKRGRGRPRKTEGAGQ